LGNEDPGPYPDLDIAFNFQRDQGFADRGTADLQLLRQLTLGRQALTGAEIFGADAAGNLIRNHAIETSDADRMK